MSRGWRLAGQGAWAVADQGLFALAGFTVNLLLARWLGAAEYGVFGVAFTVFLLVGMTYTALVIEPLLVFGSGRWRVTFRTYLRRALALMGVVAAGTAVLLLASSALVARRPDAAALAQALLTLVWAGPCIVLQWTMRRACYVHGRPAIAAAGGALYLALLLAAVALFRETIGLDARTAFVAMAAVSVLVAAFLAWRLSASLPPDGGSEEGGPPSRTDVWRAHWQFGRWMLASSVVSWLSADVFYLVLAPQHGFAAAGAVRAAFNLVLPLLHVLTALSTVALPWFVSALRSGDARRPILVFWGGLTAMAVAYGLLLVSLSSRLVSVLYGDAFAGIGPLVAVFALLPIATATSAAMATVLRATERSRDVFVATALAAVVGIGVGVPSTWWYGSIGAVVAIVLNGCVYSAGLVWRVRRVGRTSASP